jgi:hypothetical protein
MIVERKVAEAKSYPPTQDGTLKHNWSAHGHSLRVKDGIAPPWVKYCDELYLTLMLLDKRQVMSFRATSYTRLRACDHSTSSTLIGGKGTSGPSLLHTTLERPTEYVNAR